MPPDMVMALVPLFVKALPVDLGVMAPLIVKAELLLA